MLEIPECLVIAQQMNDKLQRKMIEHVIMNQSEHRFAFYSMNAERYPILMEGQTIHSCQAYGGMIEVDLGEYQLFFGDGAYPRYTEPGSRPPAKNQMEIEFDDRSYVTVSIQMYGGIHLVKRDICENEYINDAVNKPSPLSNEFTYDYFCKLRQQCSNRISIKAMLATEQRIPGLGNGVLQDILYQARLHPKRRIESISEEEWKRVYDSVRSVLNQMVQQGGRDTEKDFFSQPGQYMTYLSKKTYLSPCPRCGSEIRKAAYMGGTVYYCEKCQPLEV